MNNQQKLEAIIAKAIEGGWLPYFAAFDSNLRKDNIIIRYPEGVSSVNFDYQMKGHIIGVGGYDMEPYSIIFNHDLAKALWGDKFINPVMRDDKGSQVIAFQQTAWRHHLRQAVTADDPIDYIYGTLGLGK